MPHVGHNHMSISYSRQRFSRLSGKVVDIERGYQPPAPRAHHVALTDERAGRLYVFGGYNHQVVSPRSRSRSDIPRELESADKQSWEDHDSFFS